MSYFVRTKYSSKFKSSLISLIKKKISFSQISTHPKIKGTWKSLLWTKMEIKSNINRFIVFDMPNTA